MGRARHGSNLRALPGFWNKVPLWEGGADLSTKAPGADKSRPGSKTRSTGPIVEPVKEGACRGVLGVAGVDEGFELVLDLPWISDSLPDPSKLCEGQVPVLAARALGLLPKGEGLPDPGLGEADLPGIPDEGETEGRLFRIVPVSRVPAGSGREEAAFFVEPDRVDTHPFRQTCSFLSKQGQR